MNTPPAAKMIGTIKTMCSKIFYKWIWMCIFSAILMYDAIRRFITSVCFFCTYYWHPLDGYSSAREIQYIERCKGDLKSIPRHLSVIIGEDKMCPQVLSKIAVYALVADIEYISFYDTKGEFSLDDVQIPRYVSSHKMHNGRFIWSMPSDKKKSGFLRYKNGMEKSIEVVNVSYRQGMPLMVEVIKELYTNRHQAETRDALKETNELIKLIDETVKRKLSNLPNVELAIVFSKSLCSFGMLPWHTGFAEFHLVEPTRFFNGRMFGKILYKFSKCERRYGK